MVVSNFFDRDKPASGFDEIGIAGFTLLARVNDNLTLTSKAPVSYLEDGSFVSDHIVLDPIRLQLSGSVGEITIKESDTIKILSNSVTAVGIINSYVPDYTQSQTQAIIALANTARDTVDYIEAEIDRGVELLSVVGMSGSSSSTKTLPEQFIDAMEAIHFGKQLVDIDMPYRRYSNMCLTSIGIARDNKTESLTYNITAEEVRVAETIYSENNAYAPNVSTAIDGQVDDVVDIGAQTGQEVESSFLTYLFGE